MNLQQLSLTILLVIAITACAELPAAPSAPTTPECVRPQSTNTVYPLPQGKRPMEQVRKTFERNMHVISGSYLSALQRNRCLAGRLVYRITVDHSGRVLDVTLLDSSMRDETYEREVAAIIKGFRFDKIEDTSDISTFTFPLGFSPM